MKGSSLEDLHGGSFGAAAAHVECLLSSVEQVIVGKRDVVQLAVIALLARGHVLIEDVPGVGKTSLAQTLARSLGGVYSRVQFTSDLLPSDVVGVSVYNQSKEVFSFKKGPIFANVVLADEINRTTPRTQSCLLEAMSEGQISVDDKTYTLDSPFMVIATQNPFEHYGTYALPESQMDRFMMRIRIGYPKPKDELAIVRHGGGHLSPIDVMPALTCEDVVLLQDMVQKVEVDPALLDYLMVIVDHTRKSSSIELGVSTRGAMALFRAAKARALVMGRSYCIPEDFKELVLPIWAHRLVLAGHGGFGGAARQDAEHLLREILGLVPIPD